MRKAMAVAATALAMSGALGCGGSAVAAGQPGDAQVIGQVSNAQVQFVRHDYDKVVQGLGPDLTPAVFNSLSAPMRYEVLRLYARSLYGLSNWDEAHEAFVDLTRSSHATPQDWLLRLDTAMKVGDIDDAQLAKDRLEEAAASDDAKAGSTV